MSFVYRRMSVCSHTNKWDRFSLIEFVGMSKKSLLNSKILTAVTLMFVLPSTGFIKNAKLSAAKTENVKNFDQPYSKLIIDDRHPASV